MLPAAEQSLFVHVFETELGWMGLAGSDRGIQRLSIGHDSPSAARNAVADRTTETRGDLPEYMERAVFLLREYASGESVDLAELPLDLPPGTPFQNRVRRALMKVGYGRTLSYGELAELAGAPRAARAVGTVMSTNPVPLVVPCHRVLGSGGKLGGYSAPTGLKLKQRLLQLESAATGESCRSAR